MTGTDPSPDRLRRDFLRFRDRGDAAALARVFDALGPRLLLLAAHLCRAPNAAEDLVQTTFLDAMRSATGYDGAHDLEGWLVGILRHRAVDAARRRDRQRDGDAGELAEVADRGPGPLDATASQEELDALRRAIDALPAPYRDVAALRIVHGLEPLAIARALGRTPGTVRMQCHRAVQMLRRALPAGLAGLLPPGAWLRSWDAVRTEVLDAAKQAAVPVTTSLLLTGALMTTTQKILTASAALLVAAIGYLAWPSAESGGPASVSSDPVPTEMATASAKAIDAAGAATAAGPPARREAASSPLPPPAGPTVRGRAVDERGEPLAGVSVSIPEVYVPADMNRTLERLDDPPTVETGRDGRFALRIVRWPEETVGMRLALEHPQRSRCTGKIDWPLPADGLDIGDIVIPPGVRVAGRVIEPDGRPVPDARVELMTRTMHDRWPRFAAPGQRIVHTDRSGHFAVDERLDGGNGFVHVQVTGRRLVGPTERPIDVLAPVSNLDLVVEPSRDAEGLTGTVVTQAGDPVAGAYVNAAVAGARPTYTGPNGRFVVQRDASVAVPDAPFRVDVHAGGHRRSRIEAHWSDRDLRIVLEPIPAITVRVVDARSDAPVERFATTLLRDNAGVPQRRDYTPIESQPAQDHPDGRWILGAPPEGRLGVRITAADASLCPSSLVELPDDEAEPREITVRLSPAATRTIRLTTSDGTPLPDVRVTCVDAFGLTPSIFDEAFAWDDWGALSGTFLKMLVVARGTTGADGTCTLEGPAGRDLHLWLTGGGIARQIRGPFRLDAPGDLELEPTPEAVWTGRIVPAGAARDLVAMCAAASDTRDRRGRGFELHNGDTLFGSLLRYHDPALPFADDGSFRIGGLPAGTWQVTLVTPQGSRAVGTVTVTPGETMEQDVDIATIWPSEVELAVSVDGVPAAQRPVVAFFSYVPLPGEQRPIGQDFLRTDENGLLRRWCFPGEVELDVRPPRGKLWSAPIEIPAGRPLRQRVELRAGSLELTVVDADGRPVPDLELRIGRGRWSRSDGRRRTDATGHCRTAPFAAGTHAIRGRRPDAAKGAGYDEGWVDLGSIEVLPGEDVTPARVVWPAGAR